MRLGGFVEPSTVDWAGQVSLVIFFAGCGLRCRYCQNSGLLPADSGREVDAQVVENRIRENAGILDAIVLCGGEPILQPDAVVEVASIAKRHGLKVMLNTSGSVRGSVDRILASGLIDRVALDVVAPLRVDAYRRVTELATPAVVESVLYTIREVKRRGIPLEARTTVVPGLIDSGDEIREIAEALKGYAEVYILQQFDNQGEVYDQTFKLVQPPSREKMISLAHAALAAGLRGVYVKTRAMGLEKVG